MTTITIKQKSHPVGIDGPITREWLRAVTTDDAIAARWPEWSWEHTLRHLQRLEYAEAEQHFYQFDA